MKRRNSGGIPVLKNVNSCRNTSLHNSSIETEDAYPDTIEKDKIRLLILIPVMCIIFAELLIFSDRVQGAIMIHIMILIALSLSSIFIRDLKIQQVYMALMFLPVLRLLDCSIPIFFETTLYTFILVYAPMAIPLAVTIIQQRTSFEKIGITTKNFIQYLVISVPISFLLGLGEYLIIRPGYLIPDLTFVNLLKLTIIMVFFVGLVEELIFRTILQTRLESTLSVKEALIITSVLFGIMHSGHGTFYEILYTSFVGFIMGFAFYKTRSLPFIAMLHGFVNVFLFGILPHFI